MLDDVVTAQIDADVPACPDAPSCGADLNADCTVDGADLGILLADWDGAGPSDINDDGVVDGADLGLVLAAWGPCPGCQSMMAGAGEGGESVDAPVDLLEAQGFTSFSQLVE